jgi:hypothetical protein
MACVAFELESPIKTQVFRGMNVREEVDLNGHFIPDAELSSQAAVVFSRKQQE